MIVLPDWVPPDSVLLDEQASSFGLEDDGD